MDGLPPPPAASLRALFDAPAAHWTSAPALRPAPHARLAVAPPVDDAEACTALMRGGSKTFFAASLLLPAKVRAPATALYAFCRVADDAIDLRLPSQPVQAVLAQLHDRLRRIYANAPLPIEADRALAGVVDAFDLPMPLLTALLDGFAWDADGRRYETIDDLHDYAARVAGTVGAMMAVIMRTRTPGALARACDLGVAMQLTNIARDVGEDARNGRLYLPRQWLRDEGIDPEAFLAAPQFTPALGRVVQRLLDEADRLYRRAEAGIAELPRNCRPAIRAARLVYAEIGRQVERAGLDSVSARAVVSKQRKLALIAQALGAALSTPVPAAAADALPAVQFLVDAALLPVHAARVPSTPPAPMPMARADGNFYERTLWVIDLFERMAERNRERSVALMRPGAAIDRG